MAACDAGTSVDVITLDSDAEARVALKADGREVASSSSLCRGFVFTVLLLAAAGAALLCAHHAHRLANTPISADRPFSFESSFQQKAESDSLPAEGHGLAIDKDGSGDISMDELKDFVEEVKNLYQQGNSRLELDTHLEGEIRSFVEALFHHMDENGDEALQDEECQNFSALLPFQINDEEFENILESSDHNHDNALQSKEVTSLSDELLRFLHHQ